MEMTDDHCYLTCVRSVLDWGNYNGLTQQVIHYKSKLILVWQATTFTREEGAGPPD